MCRGCAVGIMNLDDLLRSQLEFPSLPGLAVEASRCEPNPKLVDRRTVHDRSRWEGEAPYAMRARSPLYGRALSHHTVNRNYWTFHGHLVVMCASSKAVFVHHRLESPEPVCVLLYSYSALC